MNTAVNAELSPARAERFNEVRPSYLEALTLIERLHRRLLDVIKDAAAATSMLSRRCCSTISATRN